jgi:hypothetical protein
MKRQRGRGRKPGGGGGGGGNHGNRPLESNGPDNTKIRGNAAQIYEKYMMLSRDAQSSGDRVKSENLLQHAEHYYRIMAATMPRERLLQQESNGSFGPGEEREERETEDAAAEGARAGEEAGAADDAEDAEGEEIEARGERDDDGEEGAEAGEGGEQRGRNRRRRNRNRRHEGDRVNGERAGGERVNAQERFNGGPDREARSALDALAHKQAAVAGD